MPIAINENIVTDRTTDGESPANKAKIHNVKMMILNLNSDPCLFFGKGFNKNVTNSNKYPTCKPETDKT